MSGQSLGLNVDLIIMASLASSFLTVLDERRRDF
jgi:hypothetical protein